VVLDKPVSEARQRLESQGVVVESVQTYDRAQDNLTAYTGAPLRLNPGARIRLHERDGKVMFYSLVEEKGAIAGVSPEVRVEIADLERRKQLLGDVSEITAELARTEARRAELMDLAGAREALGALDAQKTQTRQEVDGLKAELARLQSQRAELADVAAVSRDIGAARAQLESLRQARAAEQAALSEIEARRAESAAQLNTMRTDLETLRGQQREISLEITRTRPVSDVAGVDAEMAKRLNTLGVRTVNDLARMDADRLTASRIDPAAAKAMIAAANARLKL
jgi:DNA repair exonuclease SbcCD ATPase subunit